MTDSKTPIWEQLRAAFDPKVVGKIPKGGMQLDYVGHAAVTDRLNSVVGPENWNLEPLSYNPDGTPMITFNSTNAVMWARLTIMTASKLCVGTVKKTAYELEKEIIGDALRNGAMRYGVALDLWSKDELESNLIHPENKNIKPSQTHPEEPSRDINDDAPLITIATQKKLGDLLDQKGFKNQGDKIAILNNLSKSFDKDVFVRLTDLQGEKIYSDLKFTKKEALDMLTEVN